MLHILEHAFFHTIEDTVKLLPFLFLTYLGMEYLENKAAEKTINWLSHTGKKGPAIGGLLGLIPQCGISAAAAGLYAGGVITVGTLVAVFLSTSDEMLPILISGKADTKEILFILAAKALVGIIAGLLIDLGVRKLHGGSQKGLHIHDICEKDHCHCEEGSIFYSALVHTAKIALFIFALLFAVSLITELVGMEKLVILASGYPIFSIFVVGLIGMIPNCAVSVAITTLYLEGILSFGSMFAGLLACAGVGLIVLFRTNQNFKKNVMIAGGVYMISVVCGIIMELVI